MPQTLQDTVIISGTLGVNAGTCATNEILYLPAGGLNANIIYPCYTIRNTGADPVRISITVDRGGELPQLVTPPFDVAPGATVTRFNFDQGEPAAVTTPRTFVANVFIQELADGAPGDKSAVETVENAIVAVSPQIQVTKTVGVRAEQCSTTTSATIPVNGTAYYCITLENRGDITLTQHTLVDTQLGSDVNFAYTLAPQASLVITNGTLEGLGISGSLVQSNLTGAAQHSTSITSRAPGGVAQAQSSGTASVGVSQSTVTLVKTINFNPVECSDHINANTHVETPFFYCLRITNTGEVPLTTHTLDEFLINIDVTFDYPLPPGEQMILTNQTLTEVVGIEPVLGPFFLYQGPNNIVNFTMRYTGTNEFGNVAAAQANAVVSPLATATPTPTRPPQSMPTHTPFPTDTPTITPLPDTPTPTETPIPDTPTPTLTPTPDLRVIEVQTPTPNPFAPAPGSPPDSSPDTSPGIAPQSPLDPAAAGFVPDSPLAFPTPTPTETPWSLPVEPPTETPTETPTMTPTESPVPVPTDAPEPTATLEPTPTASPTEPPAVALIVVTPVPADPGPQAQRPIVPPTPTPTPDMLMFLARTLDTAATATVWIWFLVGSLVFFASAGIVAGLFFRQNERRRYSLFTATDEDEWDDEFTGAPRSHSTRGDSAREEWPRDLP